MPIGHVVLKIYVPCKNFHVPSQYLYKSCKAYVYCWKNKYMPRLENHLPYRTRNHKCLCALWQDLHAPARLNVEPYLLGTICDRATEKPDINTLLFRSMLLVWFVFFPWHGRQFHDYLFLFTAFKRQKWQTVMQPGLWCSSHAAKRVLMIEADDRWSR